MRVLCELVTDCVQIDEVELRHSFHLPAHTMALTVPPFIAGRSIEQQVVRMNVDLDSPPHRWHSQVKSDPSAARQKQRLHLSENRNTASAQTFGNQYLGMRIRCSSGPRHERGDEALRSGARRMGESTPDGAERCHRALSVIQQLLDHRSMVQRAQVDCKSNANLAPLARRMPSPLTTT